MITFYHAADFHFGVENYGKIDSQTGMHTRLLDFVASLNECVTRAIDEKIDFFLFCGDAYKTAIPTPTQQKALMTLLLKLHAANIPVVIVVGNHDNPVSFGKSHALDVFDYVPVDGFYVFSKPGVLKLETKNGPVSIVGVPWPTRNYVISHDQHRFKSNAEVSSYLSEKVGTIIDLLATDLDPKIPTVFAGHLTVSTGVFSGSEKCAVFGNDPLFLPSQLAKNQFDYVALGHLHRYQNLNKNGHPAVVYAGSIERVDFGERKEEKGFCRVILHPDKQGVARCEHAFISIKTRPMMCLEYELVAGKDYTQQLLDYLKLYDMTGAIVKIIYHVPENNVYNKIDYYALERACSMAHHVVGFFPVYKQEVREKRAILTIDMDAKTLLEKYFDAKDIQGQKKERLLIKAQTLQIEGDISQARE